MGTDHLKAVVMGASAGGLEAVTRFLVSLPAGFSPPILLVQHLHSSDSGQFAEHLKIVTGLQVSSPCDKETIQPGHVYVAPSGYHMLVEKTGTIALSIDERVNWSRPSIDLLFESAARAWGEKLAAIIMSGANADGTRGIVWVKAMGGRTFAQSPETADNVFMPQSAINSGYVDHVLAPEKIAEFLKELIAG